MSEVAGEVKIILAADAASYSAALDKAQRQLSQLKGKVGETGAATRKEFSEARGTVMVLGEEIGVHLPRHVQRFIAELPGVAGAMSAAFSGVAVVAIGVAIYEAGEKVVEFIHKNEEAARKNAEAWRSVSTPLRLSTEQLQLANDKLSNAIAKVEHKPENKLKEALDEAIVSADELAQKLDTDIAKIAETLKAQQQSGVFGFLMRVSGNAGDTSGVSMQARGFQEQLRGVNDNGNLSPADKMAQLQEIAELEHRIAQDRIKSAQGEVDRLDRLHRENDPAGKANDTAARQVLAAWREYSFNVGQMATYAGVSNTHTALEMQRTGLSGDKDKGAMTFQMQQLVDKKDSGDENYYKFRNPEIYNQDSKLNMDNEDANAKMSQAFDILRSAQRATASHGDLGVSSDTSVFSARGATYEPLVPNAAMQEFQDRLRTLSGDFTSVGDVLAQTVITGLKDFNKTMVEFLTTTRGSMQNQHPWRQMGHSIMSSVTGSALKYGEGTMMNLLMGKNPNAQLLTKANPGHVIIDNMGNVGFGASSGGDGIGGLLGKLMGGGRMAASVASSTVAGKGVGSVVGSLLKDLPGFAAGGSIASNMPSIVGELGPELFMPRSPGRIVPNNQIGGGGDVNIDARGSDNPAATEARLQRAISALRKEIPSLAIAGLMDNNGRLPASRRL